MREYIYSVYVIVYLSEGAPFSRQVDHGTESNSWAWLSTQSRTLDRRSYLIGHNGVLL